MSTEEAAVQPTPMPFIPPETADAATLDMQHKLIQKQKQLLELQQKKLELELLQTKVNLEKRLKSADPVSKVCNTSLYIDIKKKLTRRH